MINIRISEKYEVDSGKLENAMRLISEGKVVLYAMSGKMGAGKDTIGDEIKGFLERHGYKIVSMSYALPMRKEMQDVVNHYEKHKDYEKAAKLFNASSDEIKTYINILNGKGVYERTDETRQAIQYWGTDVRRKHDTNYWVKQLVKMTIDELNKGNCVEISDVRFENEADSILDLNGKIVRIELSDDTRINRIVKRDNLNPTEKHLNHISETTLDKYKFDRVIDGENSVQMITNQALDYILGD